MVAWSSQNVPHMLQAQHSSVVTDGLGTDIMGAERSQYNVNLVTLSLIAMVMKAVQDIVPEVATDQFWLDRLNTAVDTGAGGDRSGWPGWVLLQVKPEDLAKYGATTADSVPALQAKINAYNAGL